MPAARSSSQALLTVVALALAGCGSCQRDGSSASGKAIPAGRVRVKLPDGWAAQSATEDHLEVGPTGRAVLRIDLKPGAGARLPTAERLKAELTQALPSTAGLKQVDALENEEVALVVVFVPERGPDAGSQLLYQLLGAKRIGEDLFLCASIPGAAEDEVKRAARACEDVEKP